MFGAFFFSFFLAVLFGNDFNVVVGSIHSPLSHFKFATRPNELSHPFMPKFSTN